MSRPDDAPIPASSTADYCGRLLYFAALTLAIFAYPTFPVMELDSSWRQALTYALVEGWQFGKDIVFTYGPLGSFMGNTYSGVFFWPFVAWQVCTSLAFARVIYRQGLRLSPYPRAVYWTVMLLLGVCYIDALHTIIIFLVGMDLLRDAGGPMTRRAVTDLILIGILSAVKFPNMLLTGVVVATAAGFELAARRPRALWPLLLWPGGTFLLVWVLCRQDPLNLPAYILHSLDISSGYVQAMGLPASTWSLVCGLLVLLGLVAYALIHLWGATDKARALARCLLLGAFVYINWKHGFVRADGHIIGFYIAALVPITAFPALLDDAPRIRWLGRGLMLPALAVCLIGLQNPLPVTRDILPIMYARMIKTIDQTLDIPKFYEESRMKLRAQRTEWDLPKTRAIVGRASIDLLGYNVALILNNRFNYQPRPGLQSYLAYTPGLIAANADFYASDRAPDFVLFKFETIDGRFPPLDDSRTLYLFMHRYEYVHAEKNYQLWRRKPGPFDAAALAPRPLRTAELTFNQPHLLGADSDKLLWAQLDIRRSLLGRLREFFYKPPFVQLRLMDAKGRESFFRLPLPQARAGFMLSPVIDDEASYMRFASDAEQRAVREITVVVDEADRKYLAPTIRLELSELTRSHAGEPFLREQKQAEFPGFQEIPVTNEEKVPTSVAVVDGHTMVVLHAPSLMAFRIPRGVRQIAGTFGFLPGAYINGGNTDGAEFVVYWFNGSSKTVLFRRSLNPVSTPADRGVQTFTADLPARPDGRIYLQVLPGPEGNFSWDWTAWGGIRYLPAQPE
jgi:hypothetical protein